MVSSSAGSDAEGPGDALAAFGLVRAERLRETLDTGGVFIAKSDGLNVVARDESLGTHDRRIEGRITRYSFIRVITSDAEKIQQLAPHRFTPPASWVPNMCEPPWTNVMRGPKGEAVSARV